MPDDLAEALRASQSQFSLRLTQVQIERLTEYADLLQRRNAVLNLVGPCSTEEFATRHLLESLTLLDHLPQNAKFADVGAGGGLPSIPCLLVREDLHATLIEAKEKKAVFLDEAIDTLGLKNRATVEPRQFSEVDLLENRYVTCRALDKFSDRLPQLVKWSRDRGMLLFGGENLKVGLENLKVRFTSRLMPLSERRFLFVVQ